MTNEGEVRRRVLVVDDDPTIVRLITRLLTRDSTRWEIDGASCSEDGIHLVRLAQAEGRPYAVAWVDLFLERGADGLATTHGIWREDPAVEIVLCTGLPEATSAREISQHASLASDQLVVLCKPFETVEVCRITQALAEKWELRRHAQGRMAELERRVTERTAELEQTLACLRAEIADREKIEVELLHAQKMEAVGQLAAGIAHEINTPLQFVGDSLYFLREASTDMVQLCDAYRALAEEAGRGERAAALEEEADLPFVREEIGPAFDRTFEGLRRVGRIVGAMKEFAHPGGPDAVAADLNQLVDTTLTVARNEYKYVAEVETALEPLPLIQCHPDDLGQVLLNLVVNAAHAIGDTVESRGEKGRISIHTRDAGDGHVELTVTDDGPGVPAHIRAKVFEPFFTTKPVGKGTGQGLALAHSIVVERHGGTITVDAGPDGRGACFRVRLPVDGPMGAREEAA